MPSVANEASENRGWDRGNCPASYARAYTCTLAENTSTAASQDLLYTRKSFMLLETITQALVSIYRSSEVNVLPPPMDKRGTLTVVFNTHPQAMDTHTAYRVTPAMKVQYMYMYMKPHPRMYYLLVVKTPLDY